MRTLYHIPIIHSIVDLGLPKRYEFQEYDAIWDLIETRLKTIGEYSGELKLYQDSHCFHDTNHDRDFFEKMAEKSSRNYIILLKYINQGAVMVKTESAWRALVGGLSVYVTSLMGRHREALRKPFNIYREKFIAQQINNTLMDDETGLLFLGIAHVYFQQYLDPNIRVIRLVDPKEVRQIQASMKDIKHPFYA